MSEKQCEDCRFGLEFGLHVVCAHPEGEYKYSENERSNEDGCGPEGKLFKPREAGEGE